MNLIEQGIHKRLDKLADHVDVDPRFNTQNDKYCAIYEQVKVFFADTDLLDEFDCAVGALVSATIEAAYKMGIHDGFNIRDNVNELINLKE